MTPNSTHLPSLVGRIMRWTMYGMLVLCVYAFGSSVVAYVRVKTGWGLSLDEARRVTPGMGDAAAVLIASSLLVALLAVVAIHIVRRLEERMDES